jgi:hypothetical protein
MVTNLYHQFFSPSNSTLYISNIAEIKPLEDVPASYLEQDEDHTVEGFNEFAHMTVSTEGTIVLSMKTENVNQWEKNRKLREAEESELNAVAMLKFKGDYDFHADEDMQALCKKLAPINTRRFLKEYKDMKVCHVANLHPLCHSHYAEHVLIA